MQSVEALSKMSGVQYADTAKIADKSKSKQSSNDIFSARTSLPTKSNPPIPSRCGTILSPYDVAFARNYDAKLLSNKVHNAWYKRYAYVLPEDFELQFQPYEEVQNRDDNIAVQYFLGNNYRSLENAKDKWAKMEREAIIRRYNKMKQTEEDRKFVKPTSGDELLKVHSLRSIIAAKKAKETSMKEMFGPSGHERTLVTPVCLIFLKLKMKRKRKMKVVPENSKWHSLKNPLVKKKIQALYRTKVTSQARLKFIKVIHTVLFIKKFIAVVSKLAGDTHYIFKDIKVFQTERNRLLEKFSQPDALGRKKFNPSIYTFKKEVHLSMELKMGMMSSWQQRSSQMIDKVIEALQQIRTFVAYPIAYQKLLAKSAWFIVVPAFRVVIRQSQPAVSYYIMINGRAKVEKFVENPFSGDSEFTLVKTLKAQDSFGEECITKPGSLREWTITTETTCEMLSVNCHEFQEMVLTASKYDDAPEHIRFIGSLHFLRNFPKLKLLEEAIPNINVAHFLNDTVVTVNLELSEYVYVIYYGTCNVLKEIPPPGWDSKKGYDGESSSTISWKSEIFKPKMSRNSSQKTSSERSRRSYKQREKSGKTQETVSAYFEKKRNYIEGKQSLRAILHKELEKRQNEFLNYRNTFLAEAHEIEGKCRYLSQTLSLSARMHFLGGQRNLPALSPSTDFGQCIRGAGAHRMAIDGAMKRKIFVTPGSADSTITSSASTVEKKSITKMKEDKSSSDMLVLHLPSKGSIAERDRFPMEDSYYSDSSDSESIGSRYEKRYSNIVGSNMNIIDTVFRNPAFAKIRKTHHHPPPVDEQSPFSACTIPEEPSKRHKKTGLTQWTIVKSTLRGDVVGVEYLDFRTEPFDPPKGIMSLVSNGSTVIMIKKEFLLKYLRKDW